MYIHCIANVCWCLVSRSLQTNVFRKWIINALANRNKGWLRNTWCLYTEYLCLEAIVYRLIQKFFQYVMRHMFFQFSFVGWRTHFSTFYINLHIYILIEYSNSFRKLNYSKLFWNTGTVLVIIKLTKIAVALRFL